MEKVKRLSPEKSKVAEEFVDSLLQKHEKSEELYRKAIAEKRRKNFGNMKEQIRIADDFNETPEDFKKYL